MSLWQDLRFAARLLVKGRWFTLAAIVALALGIGANVTVFTIVNAVLLRGLPLEKPEQIVMFGTQDAQGRPGGSSFPDFQDWKRSARSFSSMVFVVSFPCNVSDEGHAPEQYNGAYASADMFRMLNEHPVIGRDFRPDDDRPGAEGVVMLADTIWKKRYNGDRAIVGKVIRAQGITATVIGVMPEGMQFPFNADLWLPEGQWLPGGAERNRNVHGWTVIGRLKDGVRLEQAQAEMATIGAKLARDYPKENNGLKPTVDTFTRRTLGPQIRFFLVADGSRGLRPADCLRQRGESPAGAPADRSREIGIRFSVATRWQ